MFSGECQGPNTYYPSTLTTCVGAISSQALEKLRPPALAASDLNEGTESATYQAPS